MLKDEHSVWYGLKVIKFRKISFINSNLTDLKYATEDISVGAHSITTNGFYQTTLSPTIPLGYALDHAVVINKNSNYSIVTSVACTDVSPSIIRVAEWGGADFVSSYVVRAYYKKV